LEHWNTFRQNASIQIRESNFFHTFIGRKASPQSSFTMVFLLPIEVKAYLKRFLEYYHPCDPFVLTEKNRYGIFLLNSLRFTEVVRNGKKYTLQGRTVRMQIQVKEHYERSFGINISSWHQYQFNAILLDEFHDRMVEHIAQQYTG